MPVGHLFQDLAAEPLAEFHNPFLMAGGAEMSALARKSQQILVVTVFAFHSGKAVVQIAALQIPVNDLLQIGAPEAVLPGKMLIVDTDEDLKIVLYSTIVIGQLGISGAVDCCWERHDSFPP